MNTWDNEQPRAVNDSPRLKVTTQDNPIDKDAPKVESPVKHKDYIQKEIDTAMQYSPDYRLKKLNNYDNTLKHLPRNVLEKYELSKLYHREPRALKESSPKYVNLGSAFGPGNRAILYASVPKNKTVDFGDKKLQKTN